MTKRNWQKLGALMTIGTGIIRFHGITSKRWTVASYGVAAVGLASVVGSLLASNENV
jgi:hypothetical protein